jgi:hypothetical protein
VRTNNKIISGVDSVRCILFLLDIDRRCLFTKNYKLNTLKKGWLSTVEAQHNLPQNLVRQRKAICDEICHQINEILGES